MSRTAIKVRSHHQINGYLWTRFAFTSCEDLIFSPVILETKNIKTNIRFMIQKHHIVPTIINFVTGMSFAPAKILSSELMPPNSKKDNAVKIETREKFMVCFGDNRPKIPCLYLLFKTRRPNAHEKIRLDEIQYLLQLQIADRISPSFTIPYYIPGNINGTIHSASS